MKTLRNLLIVVIGLLAMAGVCRAQYYVSTNSGWAPVGAYDYVTDDIGTLVSDDDGNPPEQFQANFQPMTPPTPPVVAEVITPEIQALADGLQDDPVRIFNYVHDHIRYVVYFGSKKGAQLTLLEKAGNDFDQCALLVALLRAAGYSNAAYQFGWMTLPFDNPDGSHQDLHHWLGLNFTNNNWAATSGYLNNFFGFWRGYPGNVIYAYSDQGDNHFAIQRVWVTLPLGGTTYLLDPSFKVSEPIAGISLATAMGSDTSTISNALMTAAGGIDFGNLSSLCYVTNLDEASLRGTLAGYTGNLLNFIQSNCPNASVEQILGGQYIVPSTNTALSQTLLFPTINMNGTMPVIAWVNEPTNIMATLTIKFATKSHTWFMPQLQGQRLSLIYGGATAALYQEDTLLAQGSIGASDPVTLTTAMLNASKWNTTNNTFVSGGWVFQQGATYYAHSSYAILYAFEPDWGWLQERQRQLALYRQQGLSDTSRQVVTETLNIMGLTWQLQTEYLGRALAAQIGVLPMYYEKMGRMAQENGKGYYVDVYLATSGSCSSTGQACTPACDRNAGEWLELGAYFGSAMEHGMIEQLQSSNLVAASTVKMLQLANTNHQAIYLACSTNWATVKTKLTGYNTTSSGNLAGRINAGYQILLPQNGNNAVAGAGTWTGYGLVARSPNSGEMDMLIGSGTYGGYVSDLGASVDPGFVDYFSYSQPLYYSPAPVSVPNVTGADPVDMASGAFQVQTSDLSLGQTEPRGLSFARYYSSSRRNSNLVGMSPGWLHSYYLNAATISSPQAGLGGTTPAQMAPMLAAVASAISVYNRDQPDPKNWAVTALIAKWGIDQLTAKAVSVSLGKDTIQFVQQPDGSYTPPANCTSTLTQSGSGYSLQERHGRTFNFNSSGWGTSVVDPYNQSLSLSYNSSNWVSTVQDWKGRTLTLTYSSSPKRLVSVSDNITPSRSVGFGYSSKGDLNSVTDPEGKASTFTYDTNHQITATFNALNQIIASNIYNGFGRVTTQFTQGDTNKTWRIFWSGWQSVSQDPSGGKQTYFYDDKSRPIAEQDALGNLNQKVYDGQDHVVMSVSSLNEINQFIYDGNQNLIQTIDPLGFTNLFIYDANNSLVCAIDARGNPSMFGYNNQFSVTGQTNGAGDWLSYTYNTDGTLYSRVDSAGAITYGYDSYGQLNSISYPNSLGSESFINNSFGDITSHTDGNGNVTHFSYNNRRQLTNSVAPANVTASIAYDAVGNQLSVTDARGNIASNVWSATRKLLASVLPATPQGTPVVTNTYDNRDWLIQTLDPLQKPVRYTNDAAGRLVSATDPLSRTVAFGYDSDGRRIAVTNAALEVALQSWDARGKPVQLIDGAQHTSSQTYDSAGNQTFLTNRNGKLWQFQFDGANRLTNTISPLGKHIAQIWNNRGLLQTVVQPSTKAANFYYDARGRLTNRNDTAGSIACQYDANSNLTNLTETVNSQTSSISVVYDAYNRMSSYQDVYGNVIQYRYDSNGNLTNLVYPGGRTVAYYYDRLNRLTNVTDWAQRKTAITYDLDSRIRTITRPNGSYRTMDYDAAGQLTNVWEQMANTLPIAWFRFNWANSGSMAWEFAAPQPHPVTVPARTMTYDDDNRLSTFNGQSVTVDDDGNLTVGPLTNNTYGSFNYDARNRLLNVGGVTNLYDPAGTRVGVISGTNVAVFVVNPNAGLPQVLMRIASGATNYYVYGPGLLYQVTETGSATSILTYHYDYRGSTIALSDGNGVVTDRIEYSLYGLTTYRAGTTDTPFLFNGKFGVQTDPSGLLYMRARYYNPYLCRFLSADPSGFGGGLNHYAYANGNPVTYLDPFGLGAISDAEDMASWIKMQREWDDRMQAIQDMLDSTPQLSDAQKASMLMNMVPLIGGIKQAAEGIVGTDFVSGERIQNQALCAGVGVLGIVTFLAPEEAVVQEEAAAAEDASALSRFGTTKPTSLGEYQPATGEISYNREAIRQQAAASGVPWRQELYVTGYHEQGHALLAPVNNVVQSVFGLPQRPYWQWQWWQTSEEWLAESYGQVRGTLRYWAR